MRVSDKNAGLATCAISSPDTAPSITTHKSNFLTSMSHFTYKVSDTHKTPPGD